MRLRESGARVREFAWVWPQARSWDRAAGEDARYLQEVSSHDSGGYSATS